MLGGSLVPNLHEAIIDQLVYKVNILHSLMNRNVNYFSSAIG
jgi:hypothetical protein